MITFNQIFHKSENIQSTGNGFTTKDKPDVIEIEQKK